MTVLCHTFLLFTVSMASLQPQTSSRSRRGLLELAGVIKCSTGRSALSYVKYGCYCGHGGQGWPRDRADWCCHRHDCCYGYAEFAGCQTKAYSYLWTCEEKGADCDAFNDRCANILCRCDREAARCLREAPYNQNYALWPNFLCGYLRPTCHIY